MAVGLDAVRYAGVNARIRGLYSRLLGADTWDELLASADLPSAYAVLRTTPYGDLLAETEHSGDLPLEQIERRLSGKVATTLRKAMTLTSGHVHKLIMVWWQHFELENLKALFRALDQGMEPDVARRFLIPLGDYSTLPWDALLHERSVMSLIDRLSNTHYINPLRNAWPVYQRERSLFAIEIALDIRYYRDLAAAISHLGNPEQSEARRILGTRLDILNILWAFRYRVYYGLSAEEIVNYTLWHTVRTDANLVREIALGADPRDIVERVWGPNAVNLSLLQGSSALPVQEGEMLPRLELALERFWRQLAERQMSGYPFRLGTLLGYLVLEELEVRDLVTLLEGKNMGWKPERIGQHLIRSKE